MELTRDPRTRRRMEGAPALIECAQCGERLYLPEWTEFLERGRVRHLWACDTCGYAFETTVHFADTINVETA